MRSQHLRVGYENVRVGAQKVGEVGTVERGRGEEGRWFVYNRPEGHCDAILQYRLVLSPNQRRMGNFYLLANLCHWLTLALRKMKGMCVM